MAYMEYPTEVFQIQQPWLYVRNKQIHLDKVDPVKTGKWLLFVSKVNVNSVWNKVRDAVNAGQLWHAKVSTTDPSKCEHTIMIHTKDYTDIKDVISVLDYLEISGIKSRKKPIYYKTDQQTNAGVNSAGNQKAWIYSSAIIRKRRLPREPNSD